MAGGFIAPDTDRIPGSAPSAADSFGRPVIRQAPKVVEPKTPAPQTAAQAEADRLDVDLKREELADRRRKASATGITPEKMQQARIDAVNKINTIRDIRRALDGMAFPNVSGTGFGDWLKAIPGTAARGIDAKLGNLKAGGALAEVLKLSQETGKNPFTPMSNSDVELISRNVGNLDQGQPLEDFIKQLDLYEAAYGRGFIGAGGEKGKLFDKNRADGPWAGKKSPEKKAPPKTQSGVKFLGFEGE